MNFNKRFLAFTLCEVLIVLGILGVVSEITIPTLYNGFAKQTTVTKLQKTYTLLYQAIKLSEVDNGPTNTWNYGDGKVAGTENFFKTYLAPYMKYTDERKDSYWVYVYLVDGTLVLFHYNGNNVSIFASFSNLSPDIEGKNRFDFLLYPTRTQNAFTPYDYNPSCADKIGTRQYWTCDSSYGCNSTGKAHCAGLIMYDGWQIKSDYPYFN